MGKVNANELIERLNKDALRYRAMAACCSDPQRKESLLDNMRLCRVKAEITERIVPSPQPAAHPIGRAGNGIVFCYSDKQ